jgi:hypothetical protein
MPSTANPDPPGIVGVICSPVSGFQMTAARWLPPPRKSPD